MPPRGIPPGFGLVRTITLIQSIKDEETREMAHVLFRELNLAHAHMTTWRLAPLAGIIGVANTVKGMMDKNLGQSERAWSIAFGLGMILLTVFLRHFANQHKLEHYSKIRAMLIEDPQYLEALQELAKFYRPARSYLKYRW
jgi:hypothetical protein